MPGMLSLGVNAAKGGFLDRAKIMKAVGRARARVLNEQGRLVRKLAMESLVYARDSAPAGSPPHAHKTGQRTRVSKSTGRVRTRSVSLLREFLFYAYDSASQSVVVGPAKLNGTKGTGTGQTVPSVQEHGGTVRTAAREIFITNAAGRDARSGRFVSRGKTRVAVGGTIRIRPHPYMGPALEKARPSFAAMWRDQVR
jgi:hypothetical protein